MGPLWFCLDGCIWWGNNLCLLEQLRNALHSRTDKISTETLSSCSMLHLSRMPSNSKVVGGVVACTETRPPAPSSPSLHGSSHELAQLLGCCPQVPEGLGWLVPERRHLDSSSLIISCVQLHWAKVMGQGGGWQELRKHGRGPTRWSSLAVGRVQTCQPVNDSVLPGLETGLSHFRVCIRAQGSSGLSGPTCVSDPTGPVMVGTMYRDVSSQQGIPCSAPSGIWLHRDREGMAKAHATRPGSLEPH